MQKSPRKGADASPPPCAAAAGPALRAPRDRRGRAANGRGSHPSRSHGRAPRGARRDLLLHRLLLHLHPPVRPWRLNRPRHPGRGAPRAVAAGAGRTGGAGSTRPWSPRSRPCVRRGEGAPGGVDGEQRQQLRPLGVAGGGGVPRRRVQVERFGGDGLLLPLLLAYDHPARRRRVRRRRRRGGGRRDQDVGVHGGHRRVHQAVDTRPVCRCSLVPEEEPAAAAEANSSGEVASGEKQEVAVDVNREGCDDEEERRRREAMELEPIGSQRRAVRSWSGRSITRAHSTGHSSLFTPRRIPKPRPPPPESGGEPRRRKPRPRPRQPGGEHAAALLRRLHEGGYLPGPDLSVALEVLSPDVVKAAAERFGHDHQVVAKWLSGSDLKKVALFGCPSVERRTVFASKRLRAFFNTPEDKICSSCKIRSSCHFFNQEVPRHDKVILSDTMRILALFVLDACPQQLQVTADLKASVCKLLKDTINLSN